MTWMIIAAVVVVLILIFAAMYNGLVRLNVRSEEAWSDITVRLVLKSRTTPL